jgi:O-antigen/teichoic acid export membrane protein
VIAEFIWVAVGQGLSLVLLALSVKILTSALGQSEYGRLALSLTIPVIVATMLYGPLTASVSRFQASYRAAGRLDVLIGTALRLLQILTATLLTASVAIGAAVFIVADSSWAILIGAGFVIAMLQGSIMFFNALENTARKRARAAIHQVLMPLSRVAFGTAAVLISRTSTAAASGLALGLGCVLVSQYVSFRNSVLGSASAAIRASPTALSDIWGYGKFPLVWGVFSAAHFTSDVWALKAFRGDATVGIYALALLLASGTVVLAGTAVGQFVFPISFERAGHGNDPEQIRSALDAIRQSAFVMLALTGAAFIFTALLGDLVVVALSSELYRPVAGYLPWVMLGLGITQVGHLLSLVPMVLTEMRLYTILKISIATVTVLWNFVGAWAAGVTGVVLTLLVSALVYVGAVVYLNSILVRRFGRRDQVEP